MQSNKTMTIVIVAALTLLLTASSTAAGLPVEEGKSAGEISLAGTVLSKISYQGKLTDSGGNPLDGTYDLVFQLWDDASAGSQLGSDIPKNDVSVSNGLFTVELDVPQDAFNGQRLWLQISVNGQPLSPRQELLPVPYALGLKPGAVIASSSSDAALYADNESGGYGLSAYSEGNIGLYAQSGLIMIIPPPSGMIGAYGVGSGEGVYGQGGHTGVHGVGSNDGVKGESVDGNAVHGISANGSAIHSEGDLYVTGAFRGDLGGSGAPFPRPAYNSGWQSIAQGEVRSFMHGLGGDPDDYVVDLQFQNQFGYRHQMAYGGNYYASSVTPGHTVTIGGYWYGLDDQEISVTRFLDDTDIAEVRVRIWVVR